MRPLRTRSAALLASLVAVAAGTACVTTRALSVDAQAEIARGGRLYDNWISETGVTAPDAPHALYPADGAYAKDAATTWRCKECHGWDYLGRDGAYATGKHATGIPGIQGGAFGDTDEVARRLAAPPHDYGARLSPQDLRRVALFVTHGQLAMESWIDRTSREIRGDAARGRVHYAALCAGCHGAEGHAEDMPVLGKVARENPWEFLHKVLNGQPNTGMPALRTLDGDVAADIAAFAQTLPADG